MQEERIEIRNLLLDPNNPRFAQSFGATARVADDAVEGLQKQVLNRFRRNSPAESDGFFDIDDLWNSMSIIGFVPIDRIVVRKLADSDKYLVIEGNRRIATAQLLLTKDDVEPNPDKRLGAKITDSLKAVEALVLETEGKDQHEIEHRVSVILGLRHFGSVLPWSPLPKAFNTYTEYMGLNPAMETFEFKASRVTAVAGRLSVKPGDVRNACMTYIVYRQLCATFEGIEPLHYSLIQSAVTNRTLTGATGYFVLDSVSCTLDEPSLSKLNDLCQFARREDLPSAKKTIPQPQSFRYLARVVKESRTNPDQSVRDYAMGLLLEVESHCQADEENDDSETYRNAESANDSLVAFINQKEWAAKLGRTLDKQDESLAVSEFIPIGSALPYLNEVVTTFDRLRRVLQV